MTMIQLAWSPYPTITSVTNQFFCNYCEINTILLKSISSWTFWARSLNYLNNWTMFDGWNTVELGANWSRKISAAQLRHCIPPNAAKRLFKVYPVAWRSEKRLETTKRCEGGGGVGRTFKSGEMSLAPYISSSPFPLTPFSFYTFSQ